MASRPHIAAIRFGLGPRVGETLPDDPEAWLLGQVRPPGVLPGLPIDECMMSLRRDGRPPEEGGLRSSQLLRVEMLAWTATAVTSPNPLVERLTQFWMNHFTVSYRRSQTAALMGHFLREAIRPNIFGRFEDLLLASTRHPAMQFYLDNRESVGPDSPAGLRQRRGLNENLAREILELHTLSPRGGYTQRDVTEFAKILTGWTLGRGGGREPEGFIFRPEYHQPGEKTLLGQTIPEGEEGGIAALRMLAHRPACHRFLAEKLVRHFVADDPPPRAVARIQAVFGRTGGDLAAVTRALIALPEAWAQPLSKLRSPWEYIVAAVRAFGMDYAAMPVVMGAIEQLGQPIWAAQMPNGYPDDAASWAVPESLVRRVDWVSMWSAGAVQRGLQPVPLAETVLGPLLGAESADAVRRAPSARAALTLLLSCPEFMRR